MYEQKCRIIGNIKKRPGEYELAPEETGKGTGRGNRQVMRRGRKAEMEALLQEHRASQLGKMNSDRKDCINRR